MEGNNKNMFKENSRINFNRTAEVYDESSDGKFVAPMYEEIVSRVISTNPKKILDVGCGTGNVLIKLSANYKFGLYGVDISEI